MLIAQRLHLWGRVLTLTTSISRNPLWKTLIRVLYLVKTIPSAKGKEHFQAAIYKTSRNLQQIKLTAKVRKAILQVMPQVEAMIIPAC